jgi:hypothetical protein
MKIDIKEEKNHSTAQEVYRYLFVGSCHHCIGLGYNLNKTFQSSSGCRDSGITGIEVLEVSVKARFSERKNRRARS